jgi:hypothetical protein
MDTPWEAAATVLRYAGGLHRVETDFAGNLYDAVAFTLSQPNEAGDGYIIQLNDGSRQWEGPEIAALAHEMLAG